MTNWLLFSTRAESSKLQVDAFDTREAALEGAPHLFGTNPVALIGPNGERLDGSDIEKLASDARLIDGERAFGSNGT